MCVQNTAPDKVPATRDDIGRVEPIRPQSFADIVLINLGDAGRMIITGIVGLGSDNFRNVFQGRAAQGNRINEPTSRNGHSTCGKPEEALG